MCSDDSFVTVVMCQKNDDDALEKVRFLKEKLMFEQGLELKCVLSLQPQYTLQGIKSIKLCLNFTGIDNFKGEFM